MIDLSLREAIELDHKWAGSEHVLLALLREGGGIAAQVLSAQGANLAAARELVSSTNTGAQPVVAVPDRAGPGPYDETDATLASLASDGSNRPEVGDLDSYLAEVNQYPVLTAADEVELAQKIELGRDAAQRLNGNAELSTATIWWIRRAITRALSRPR